jgi:glutaredoxin
LKVTVYVKPEPTKRGEIECRQCIMTEKVLTTKGVPYERIVMDETTTNTLKELGHLSAPVVLIDGGESGGWAGFQPQRINDLIDQLSQAA